MSIFPSDYPSSSTSIAGIILAAGSSSRMGQPKQMLDIHGEKLLVRTIRMFLNAGIPNVLVVLGANEEAHRGLIHGLDVDIIHNPDWETGMGSSIKAGLKHLALRLPSVESVIVSVCDQPLLTEKTVSNLIARYLDTGKHIVASSYSDVPGVPVLFHKSYFEKLANLSHDEGAKKIIMQHLADVSLVQFPGGEVDMDTMEDYKRFIDGPQEGGSDTRL